MGSVLGWLFWALCYLAQLHPFVGPKLDSPTVFIMAREWNKVNSITRATNE